MSSTYIHYKAILNSTALFYALATQLWFIITRNEALDKLKILALIQASEEWQPQALSVWFHYSARTNVQTTAIISSSDHWCQKQKIEYIAIYWKWIHNQNLKTLHNIWTDIKKINAEVFCKNTAVKNPKNSHLQCIAIFYSPSWDLSLRLKDKCSVLSRCKNQCSLSLL